MSNRGLLPAQTKWIAIEGGSHSQFGHYGHQLFDGTAINIRETQQGIRGAWQRSETDHCGRGEEPLIPVESVTRMRFEVAAAYAIGILLPVLETYRRGLGAWAVDFTTMFEDYVAGAMLLAAAWAAHRKRHWGAPFIVVAWSYFTGLMSSSFWYQLEETVRGTVTEPHEVVVVKALLWGVCIFALVASFRHILPRENRSGQ